jgi:LPXTG-motif cell wall-anchored protein
MRIRHHAAAVAVSILATLVLAGPAFATTHTVQALDSNGGPPFHFSPATITIKAGDTITWTNAGTIPHTATGSGFDSGTLNPGQSFSHTFTSVGTISYHCTFHQALGMVGTIVVEAAGTTPPPPTGGTGGTGSSSGGEPTGTAAPLPNTGSSSSTVPFLFGGAALVLVGGIVLLILRRRPA